jgi:tRNA threonylcarbamoyl adenosine modification protein (Sua5/YciO/YrdC/YwlC family)
MKLHLKIAGKKNLSSNVEQAVTILRLGGIIIYPTDTIYGLGCLADNQAGIKRIQLLKGRDNNHPFSIICPDIANASQLAFVSNKNYRLLKKYLPGPFTFILPATKLTPKLIKHPKKKTVGIRIPDNYFCQALMKKIKQPLITTSVNKHGQEPTNNPDVIIANWLNRVDCFFDAGQLDATASTIVDLTNEQITIVRQGKGVFLDF